jgi:5-methylcytosine-specific restriction endonuclease McrA
MSNKVLVTDVTGRPVNTTSWQRAVVLLLSNEAYLIEKDGDKFLRSPSISVPKPLIIQTQGYVALKPLPDNKIVRRVLYARDDWECQYCGKEINMKTGTVDHVKPKAAFVREGRKASDAHTWDNVVTSCEKCNTKKGDRLPYQCGMQPKKTPRKPSYVQTLWAGKAFHPIQAEYIAMYHSKEIDISQLVTTKSV